MKIHIKYIFFVIDSPAFSTLAITINRDGYGAIVHSSFHNLPSLYPSSQFLKLISVNGLLFVHHNYCVFSVIGFLFVEICGY